MKIIPFAVVVLLGMAAALPARAGLKVGQMLCEYQEQPVGLDVAQPELAWKLAAEGRAARQTAYQVVVASSLDNLARDVGDLWDSGKVASDATAQIRYAGRPLPSRLVCYWKARVWDQAGAPSKWSAVATWEMGLLEQAKWEAKWIGQNTNTAAQPLPLFRREFTVSGKVRSARLYISGLGYAEARLNGAKVGDHHLDPGYTRYDKRVLYVTHDVTAQLARAREAQKQVDKLTADNTSLMQRLDAAEKEIQQFNSSAPDKDAAVASLKRQVADVKTQLAVVQKENLDFQMSVSDLKSQLDTKNAELAQIKASGLSEDEKKKQEEENELLRGIVMRQLKEQARRDQARKLVFDELSKLQVKSDVLTEQIQYLGQPVTKLNDKEKALFKRPQIQLASDEASGSEASAPVSFSLAAGKSESQPPALSRSAPVAASSDDLPAKDKMTLDKKGPDQSGASRPETAPQVETSVNPGVPDDLLPLARKGKEQFERANYREAEKTYESILAKVPNNIYALSNLGVVRFRAGKFKQAEETFKKAIAIAPEDSFSYCTLGIVYYQQGKLDDAINSLTKALAINPKYAVAHNYLGIAASQKGWAEAAVKELQAALALDSNYADANFNMAVIYATQQPPNKDLAQKYYKKATGLGAEPDKALEEILK